MSEDKISSDEVPGKFTDWLLAMGCPEEKVPSVDKVAEMCRGQYYMVWRSLMEHVDKRDVIRSKRLQVFVDDMHRCQQHRTVLAEVSHNFKRDTNTIRPEQLALWRQHQELTEKVEAAKERVTLARQDLHQLTDKIAGKLVQRGLARLKVEDTSRRVWLLQQVAQELRSKQDNLRETEAIAHSLCSPDDNDIQGKLDRCLTLLRRTEQQQSLQPASNSTANSTGGVSNNGDNDFEEQLAALVKCRGDALCMELYERRAALVSALTCNGSTDKDKSTPRKRLTPQSVLAHTASLHCTVALEAAKNKLHLKKARNKLAATVKELSKYLSGDACELLVVRCEQAHSEARIVSLQASLDEMTSRQGVFSCVEERDERQTDSLPHIYKAIESRRDELRDVIAASIVTERKILMVRECLAAVFSGFHKEQSRDEFERYKGIQVEMPQESIASLRQYYETRRARRRNKMEISLELETSDCSFSEVIDYNNPRYIDELRIYLKNFSLEKNRKLILESGDKIWIFETIASSRDRVHAAWVTAEAWSVALATTPGTACVRRAISDVDARERLRDLRARKMQGWTNTDIKHQIEQEEQTIDRIKKRLNENLLCLQKTNKTLDTGNENLRLWSENALKKYISPNRSVNGMTYKDYELCYLDNLVIECT